MLFGVGWSSALKENWSCFSLYEHCSCKGEGGLQPFHTELHENAAGEEKEQATVTTWVSLLVFVCRRLQCWAQAISGLCKLTHMLMIRKYTHTHTQTQILWWCFYCSTTDKVMVGSTQPLKYAVISGWISPHVSFRSVWIMCLSPIRTYWILFWYIYSMSSRENKAFIHCPL